MVCWGFCFGPARLQRCGPGLFIAQPGRPNVWGAYLYGLTPRGYTPPNPGRGNTPRSSPPPVSMYGHIGP